MKNRVPAGLLGMWVFLASEVLFFSTLILAFWVYRHEWPVEFSDGVRHMDLIAGSVNTAVLLTSSWTMALALASSPRWKGRLLVLTAFLGAVFLVIKGSEYFMHARDGMLPPISWSPPQSAPAFKLFFILYFLITGLHALHLSIGIGCVLWARLRMALRREVSETLLENLGLYWHFVDIVWIFLFPLFYLIGGHA